MWKRIALALVAVTLGVGDAVETQPATSVPGQWTKPIPFGDKSFLAAAPEPACDWRIGPPVDVPVERDPRVSTPTCWSNGCRPCLIMNRAT